MQSPETSRTMTVGTMKTNANTFRLPEEILEQIFGYLGQADLARVASVSTVFWRLAAARLYHEIRFDPYAYRESQLRVLKRLVFILFEIVQRRCCFSFSFFSFWCLGLEKLSIFESEARRRGLVWVCCVFSVLCWITRWRSLI